MEEEEEEGGEEGGIGEAMTVMEIELIMVIWIPI